MLFARVTFKQLVDEPFFLGALGGLTVAVVTLFSNVMVLIEADKPKLGGAVLSFLVAAALLMFLGGMISWVTDGRSGYFLTGATALAFGMAIVPDAR